MVLVISEIQLNLVINDSEGKGAVEIMPIYRKLSNSKIGNIETIFDIMEVLSLLLY